MDFSNLKWAGMSHVGLLRDHNEDSFFIDPEKGIAIVADGMGGHEGGEIASGMAIQTFIDENANATPFNIDEFTLEEILKSANRKIYNHSIKTSGWKERMKGTTAVAISFENSELCLAWTGDSRAYYWDSENGLTQISKDHTLIQIWIDQGVITEEQAKTHPQRNVILEALGTVESANVEHKRFKVKEGGKILLCSDGLNGFTSDANIEAILRKNSSPELAVEELISSALDGGGGDNVTVVLGYF